MPKRVLTGTVVSDKADKTVVVRVERRVKHPLYGKIIRLSKKYHAHDEDNAYRAGEQVRIEECAPVSKLKTWTVIDRLGAAKAAEIEIVEGATVKPRPPQRRGREAKAPKKAGQARPSAGEPKSPSRSAERSRARPRKPGRRRPSRRPKKPRPPKRPPRPASSAKAAKLRQAGQGLKKLLRR